MKERCFSPNWKMIEDDSERINSYTFGNNEAQGGFLDYLE